MTYERLELFRVGPDDIIGSTTDGANVCKSFGTKLGHIHQLCLDHGFHLAIRKVIYKKVDESKKQKKPLSEPCSVTV